MSREPLHGIASGETRSREATVSTDETVAGA